MTNLHDARVEAAARALFHDPLASDDYTWEEMVAEDNSRAELWRDDARRVLAATDAVVTVEMIAAALHGDECPDDPDDGESCSCDGNHYMRQGGIVLATIRGGEDGEAVA